MNTRRLLTLATVLALAAVATMLWSRRAGHSAVATSPNILHRGNSSEAESLDPQAARSEAALTIARDLYEGLTSIDAAGHAVPAAADRYEVSADGLTYTFHLRGNLRWSNGDPVSAADFVFAWRRLVDPATAAPFAQMLAPLLNGGAVLAGTRPPQALGVEAADAATLVVRLAQPVPYLLNLFAQPGTFPLHRASLEAYGARFAKPALMVSNGAYRLARWDFGSKIVAARNHFYWNDVNTHIERVEYHSIAQPAAEFDAYRADQLDCTATIPTPQIRMIRAQFAAELHLSPQLAVYYYGLNLRMRPFANQRSLRRAMSMVIDRERLVKSVTGLGELPANGFVPPQTAQYTAQEPDYARWSMPERIARARELLRQSGSGEPGPIELRYNTGDLHSAIAVAVASMWRESLGLDVRLHGEEFKVLLQDVERGDVAQVFRASWVADYNDAYDFLQLLQSGFGLNSPHYTNPAYDELLQRANSAGDPAARRAALEEAERLMLEDQPLIPLYFYVNKHLVKPRVHGWRDNVMNVVYSKDLSLAAAPP